MAVRKEPKYKQAINHLLTQFREEPYQSGQQLPTEFDLMKQLSLSRTTVRQAIKELTEQGIVERRHGSGTYFLGFKKKLRPAPSGWLVW
jgi:DNA-binding GntR family transcriptional regulator